MEPWAGDEPTLYVTNDRLGIVIIMNGESQCRALAAYTDVRFADTRANRRDGIVQNYRDWEVAVDNGRQTLRLQHNAGANRLELTDHAQRTRAPHTECVMTIDDDEEARLLSASIIRALEEDATDKRVEKVASMRFTGTAYTQSATRTVYSWHVTDDDTSQE